VDDEPCYRGWRAFSWFDPGELLSSRRIEIQALKTELVGLTFAGFLSGMNITSI